MTPLTPGVTTSQAYRDRAWLQARSAVCSPSEEGVIYMAKKPPDSLWRQALRPIAAGNLRASSDRSPDVLARFRLARVGPARTQPHLSWSSAGARRASREGRSSKLSTLAPRRARPSAYLTKTW